MTKAATSAGTAVSGDVTPRFPAPEGAAWLYPGDVMHARMKPKAHRFAYKVFCLLIDIDRLAEANQMSALFSVGRFNLVSFHEKDHGAGDGSSLRSHIDRLMAPLGVEPGDGRALLLCYPRLLGFAFNPISVYFVYASGGEPVAIIYEVRNTFGEMHTYVCKVEGSQLSEAGIRQERDKRFYVSPFMGAAMRYRFRILPPGGKVAVRILETDAQGPILAATFVGVQSGLTTASLTRAFLSMPLMTLKVVAGIHWEAAKLWFKGIEFHDRPAPPPPSSYQDNKL